MVKKKRPSRPVVKLASKKSAIKLDETAGQTQDTVQRGDVSSIVIHTKGIGSTGTQSYAGYPAEEYLTKLHGRQRADIFDRMERSDGQSSMLLKAAVDSILAATWDIAPGDQSPEAQADADFMKHILFRDMEKPFEEFLEEALTFMVHGHSIFELTHKVVLNHPVFGSYNGIKGLAFRSQRTIERWNLNHETDQLESVTQIVNGDLDRYVDIPAEFLIVFTLKKRGSNYEGISMLRPCYGSWVRKDLYLKLNAIGIEKFAVPTPIATIPAGKAEGTEFDTLILALEAYSSHEKAYLTKPEGWDIELHSNVYDPQKVEISIDNEDKRMTKSFLANFLELGMNGTGSHSQSSNMSDFFLSSLDHIAKKIAATINRDLIPAIIQMNRGPRATYPELKHSGISDRASTEFGGLLKTLRDSDYIQPSDADEDYIRKRIGMPVRSQIGLRKKSAPAPLFSDAKKLTLSERIKAKREAKK